jgi:hypothetical protein
MNARSSGLEALIRDILVGDTGNGEAAGDYLPSPLP